MMATPFLANLDGLTSSLSGLDSPLTPGGDDFAASSSSSKRTTALSTKLTSVLSSSYADHEIRDALRLLDSQGLKNDDSARRNLKANAQREVIECNARIVDDFGVVAAQLKRVGTLIASLNDTCAALRTHIVAARQETAPVLDEAKTLISRKHETENKEHLLRAFTDHFVVSDDKDLNVLTSSAEPLDDRFFVVLDRVKRIHKECSILLGYNTSSSSSGADAPSTSIDADDAANSSSRLGLELLESTTRTLDAAFKKLYTWIQSRFKNLDIEDPHISGSIRRALRVLSERPTLFQNCLDFFAEARQSTLSEAFQDALTGGANASAATAGKAIEFSTHEPLRYVGDMLAWVHSACVSEKEALEGLFVGDEEEISRGLNEGRVGEPWARIRGRGRQRSITVGSDDDEDEGEEDGTERGGKDGSAAFDGRKALSELISRNLALVCQTLQSRIDVTVRTSGDHVLMFKVFNLLDFYRGIFSKLLGERSDMAKLVQSMQSSTLAQFDKAVEEETSAAVSAMTADSKADAHQPHDLTPPVYLATALRQFSEICRARGPQLTEAELERFFSTTLGGILTACATVAATQIADPRRAAIYKLNYMTALKATLANLTVQVASVQVPLTKTAREIQSVRDTLVDFVATTFVEFSGVADLMTAIDTHRKQAGRQERRKWFVDNLDESAQRLDEFLASALMDAQEALKPLLDRTLAKDVVAEAVERFCTEFDELEGLLESVDVDTRVSGTGTGAAEGDEDEEDEDGGDGQVRSLRELYPRTGAEVRALLS